LKLLTAEISTSSVAFEEKIAAEVASPIVFLEASHALNLLDQDAHFDTKHASELATYVDVYEVKLASELEVDEEEYTRKVCITESSVQRMLAEEKAVSEKYYLKYKRYKDMYQTLTVARELPPPVKGGVPCGRTDQKGAR